MHERVAKRRASDEMSRGRERSISKFQKQCTRALGVVARRVRCARDEARRVETMRGARNASRCASRVQAAVVGVAF